MKKYKIFSIVIFIFLFLASSNTFFNYHNGINLYAIQKYQIRYFNFLQDTLRTVVTRVIDGDTFEIEGGLRVRLIGIDTPEKWESDKLYRDAEKFQIDIDSIKILGRLSSKYAEDILFKQKVVLITDEVGDKIDKYGRLLRYCFLEDGTFFNLKIIKDGYAFAYVKYNFSLMNEFIDAMKEAQEKELGLWKNINFVKMSEYY